MTEYERRMVELKEKELELEGAKEYFRTIEKMYLSELIDKNMYEKAMKDHLKWIENWIISRRL